MTHAKVFLISAVAATTLLSGCSQMTNDGGDTKCSDFQSAEEKTQNEAITKMLTDEGKNEPSNAELAGTRLSITAYCQTVGTPDSAIKEAPRL